MKLGTPAGTKLVGALSLLVVSGLGWTFVVGPETAALSEVRTQVENTRDQNDVLALQLISLEKQRKNLGKTRATAIALAEKFPTTADQPGLFETVTAAAEEAGIGADGVTTLAPTPPAIEGVDPTAPVAAAPAAADPATTDPAATAATGMLARQTVSVSVTGTYDDTQRLLENLEQLTRAFLITTVTLGGGEESGAYVTTITGDMFVMPPVQDPGELVNAVSVTSEER